MRFQRQMRRCAGAAFGLTGWARRGALVAGIAVAMSAGGWRMEASALAQPPATDEPPALPPGMDEETMKALLKKVQEMGADKAPPEDGQPQGEGRGDEKGKPPAANAKAEADMKAEEALARFEQLLARRPFHAAAFTGLVNHFAERGKLKDLIAEYTGKAAALPDDVALRIVLARLQLRAGDAAAAAAILDKIETLPPDLARQKGELLVLKSEVYQKTGDNAAAEKVLKEAQQLATSVSERLRLGEALADLYLRADRKEDAIASLQALADQFPDNYLHQKHIAEAMAQRGLHEAAVERYKKMLPLVKEEVERRCEVLRELGQSYEKLSKRDEAIAVYIEAVGLLASDHWLVKELHEKIVGLYRAQNRLEDLATYCRTQIARAPEQTAMRILLADVQAAMGKPDEGKKTLADAVELFPKDLALSQKRVEYLERVGDGAGVSEEYQRAIGQHGDDSELYISYGQFLASNKQLEGAKNQWQHVLGTKLGDAGLAVRLGALFEAYDLHEDAAQAYERAIVVAPKQPDGYAALSRLWRAKGDIEKAAEVMKRMGDANPEDGAIQGARAQGLRDLGKTDDALAAITRACELLPDQVRFAQIRSELLVQSGRLEDALEVRRTLIDKITNPVQQAEAIGTLVSMYGSAEKLGDLKKREEARLTAKAGDVVALLILARVADAERDFPGVRARLDGVLAVDPGNESALGHLAKLQDATGDVDGAVETYGRLIERHPTRARQFHEAIVDLKLRYGDRAGAISTLEKMAQNDPGSAATLAGVADQFVRMGEPDRALPYFEKALVIQGDRHETRLDMGKALVDAGRLEDAMAAFRIVATQKTDTDRAVEALGKLHETATQLGRLEELMDELHQQVEQDPQNTLVARALAQLLVRELEYGRALEVLDLVIRHNPRDAELALGRADVLRRQAKYDEAVEAYQGVLRFPQIDRDYVLGELGKAYFESGQVEQAKRLWKQIQHKLYAGSLLKNNGLLEDSITAFEEGIRLKPDEYALHRNLIGALESAGRTADALAAARRLLDLEPGNVWNIERLAEAHLRANDRAGAAAVAARLFSATVSADKLGAAKSGTAAQYQSFASAMNQSAAAQYGSVYGYGGGSGKSNLDRGVRFFQANGLRAELEEVLEQQIAAQADNAVLRETAANLYMSDLNKPERALALLRELETAKYPVEHQEWLGQCSQRDFMRIKQYNLIASKPALRDAELARLEAKKAEELSRDELILLSMIRSAQGNTDKAGELLGRVAAADNKDVLALAALTDLLVAGEKFKEAEPHARALVAALSENREKMHAETIERVRRDFVRSLPVEFQLRVNDQLVSDIAEKWTLGQGWSWWQAGTAQAVGYLRARLTLGTICAETDRMEEARTIWKDLAPKHGPDVDRWTMLGDTAQLHKQEDLAFEFYQRALEAAKALAGDPLLQQVYASSASQRSWYGEEGTIDKAFNSIVEAFAKRDKLVELYDFLRDTDQEGRARRLAEQYKLGEKLKPLYEARVASAAAAFKASADGPMRASPAYFAQVCKLAELHDREGDWAGAQKVYEAYLTDFPDELGMLTLLGEVAEARLKTEEAIEWEKKVLECKERLAKKTREWALRDLAITPAVPQALGSRIDSWSWANRWGRNNWSYGGKRDELERWPSWMRLAQLHLAAKNPIAAADAMQHATAEAGPQRDAVVRSSLALIQQRQQTAQMLGVLRTLAVYAPSDERVQLAFAESLDAARRKELALEVCNRMLRRGVSDLSMLAELRRRVRSLSPESAAPEATVASLEAEVKADPANLKGRLRLAKAYYYALDLDHAQEMLAALAKEAPHLEDVHEMLVEVYTLRGDSEKLIATLKAQVDRLTDDRKRRLARWRLVDELLAAGKTDEALATVKELGDPRDPRSYTRIGALLHYFGKTDEAIACLEQAGKSRQANRYGNQGGDFSVAQSLAIKGDYAGAADKILTAMDEQSRQQVQYSGVYGMDNDRSGGFAALEQVFALYPELAAEVSKRVEARRAAAPADPQAIKLLMALDRSLGRPDKADALLEQMAQDETADQGLVAQRIDLAVRRRDFPKAIAMAQKFIAQAPKPQLLPGMPAQYAGYAILQSPRTFMLCKLGDVYWDMGEKEKAFESYGQIVDKKVDETRTAYASICLMRGRTDEARTLVDEALASQKVKAPNLLQFRAFISVLDGQTEKAFDAIAEAAAPGGEQGDRYGRGDSPVQSLSLLAQRAGMVDKFAGFMQDRVKKSPDEWENYQILAQSYWQNGRPEDALKIVDQAAESAPLRQQALQQRLEWRSNQAPVEELIPLYEKLVELAEREAQPSAGRSNPYGYGGYSSYGSNSGPGQGYRDQLAELLWDKGDIEAAEKVRTERMNMQRAETHTRLGQLYLERHDYDKAQAAFTRAVELDPDNMTAHWQLASEAYCRGDLKGMAPHMLEVFLRRQTGEDAQNRYRGDDEEQSGSPGQMYEWARALAKDPAALASLSGEGPDGKGPESRIMIASLTGDWGTLESLLQERITAGSPDPLIWRLWARVQQRKGAWTEAAKAMEFLRRVKLTTISDHRDKLKLVLAGKQLKEAVAGTRQAQPGAGMAQPTNQYNSYSSGYGGYGGYSSGWWDSDSGSGTLLPSVYIKLGDFQRAERLYLLSSGEGGIEGRLPWLASLMWEQKAKDRALELMRLSLSLPSGESYYYNRGGGMLVQYATMLAECGKAEEAIDLLVRAYRWNSSAVATGGMSSWQYGNGQQQGLEQGGESSVSGALHQVLVRQGMLDKTLAKLTAESAKDPTDPQLGKLVLSLLKKERRWSELRDSLAARAAASPAESGLTLERLGVACQLAKWDEALTLLEQARKESPAQKSQWCAYEAFIHLMRNDMEKAVAAVKPLLEESEASESPTVWATVFAAAKANDQLAAHLEKQRADALADDAELALLFRLMLNQKRYDDAMSLALDEFWKKQSVLRGGDPWWRSVTRVVNAARVGGAKLSVSGTRPADGALLILASEGPNAGAKAFAALAEGPSATVESLRGLLFAQSLAGDNAAALRTNARLMEWLESRRATVWYRPPAPSLQLLAKRAIAQGNQYGGSTQAALGGGGQQISQLAQGNETPSVVLYEPLWRAHQQLQRTLLARAGDGTGLATLLRAQKRSLGGNSNNSSYGYNYNRYGYNPRSMAYYTQMAAYRSGYGNDEYNEDNAAGNDWQMLLRRLLFRNNQTALLVEEYGRLAARTPSTEWSMRGEANAATGRTEEAAQWRRREAESQLASLRATDTPDLGASARDPWRWYWYSYGYGAGNEDVNNIRNALRVASANPYGEMDLPEQPFYGEPNVLWEFALVDPAIETQLLSCESLIGPGWGSSRTLDQLVHFYRAKKQPEKVIAIIEKAGDIDQILRGPQLDDYLWACFRSRDSARFEAVLTKAERAGATLKNDLELARLAMLRLTDKVKEADEMEARLAGRCVVEPPSPCPIDRDLLSSFSPMGEGGDWAAQMQSQYMYSAYSYGRTNRYGRPNMMSGGLVANAPTIEALANALGVGYEGKVGEDDITLASIRDLYQRHGLYADAVRVLEKELAAATPTPQQRRDLLRSKAWVQSKAGQAEAANRTAHELEGLLQDDLKKSPADSTTLIRLARLYMSEAWGRDYGKANETLMLAEKTEMGSDRAHKLAVDCLYKLGRHREAWDAWKSAAREDGQGPYEEPTIYYASLAALRGGDEAGGRTLAQQALYRYPASSLAKETRELIHERP